MDSTYWIGMFCRCQRSCTLIRYPRGEGSRRFDPHLNTHTHTHTHTHTQPTSTRMSTRAFTHRGPILLEPTRGYGSTISVSTYVGK